MFIIAGLGNPGKKYENTRHNMGFLTIDLLAEEYDIMNNIIEIVQLVINKLSGDFGIGSIKIKTANTPERIKWLEDLGFVKSEKFRPELGYHEFDVIQTFSK